MRVGLVGLVIALVFSRLLGNLVFLFLVILSELLWITFAIRHLFFKCPRCEKLFFGSWWYSKVLTRECLHCQLPKYAKN